MAIFLFAIIGTLGFIVDSTVLYLLKESLGLYFARIISFCCAVFVTWFFNRMVTFRSRRSGLSQGREFWLYFKFMLVGGGINYLSYALAVTCFTITKLHPVVAVALGSLSGLIVNYLTSKYFVYKLS